MTDISLYGVKLGDDASSVAEVLHDEERLGVKVEVEATFWLLLDSERPTGPMAGIRASQGRVDLMFMNSLFAPQVPGIFREVLTSTNPDQVRPLLEYLTEIPGIRVHYDLGEVNVQFTLP